ERDDRECVQWRTSCVRACGLLSLSATTTLRAPGVCWVARSQERGFDRERRSRVRAMANVLCPGLRPTIAVCDYNSQGSGRLLGCPISRAWVRPREKIESACNGERLVSGPAAYYRCLRLQLSGLRASAGLPDLKSVGSTEREDRECVQWRTSCVRACGLLSLSATTTLRAPGVCWVARSQERGFDRER